jgi:hypothetical protein
VTGNLGNETGLSPDYFGDQRRYARYIAEWDGNYDTGDLQSIADEDARALAAGLRNVIDDIPEINGPQTWGELNLTHYPITESAGELIRGSPKQGGNGNTGLSPLQFFSAQVGRAFVGKWLNFSSRVDVELPEI